MNLFCIFSLILLLVAPPLRSVEEILTTAKLPDNKMIWPPIKLDLSKDILIIEGSFKTRQEIAVFTQGNWRTSLFLVTYSVNKKSANYPYDSISFICEDRWPTRESQITVKALDWHFTKGSKTFYMAKDEKCLFRPYFDIITYSYDHGDLNTSTNQSKANR